MREAQSLSYLQICALLDHTWCKFDLFLEWPDNHISIKLASARGTVLILSFYQLLKDSWHLTWHKAAWYNIKSTFPASHCCVPRGCSTSVWHKGSVSSYSDQKHKLNLALRYKTLIEITETSQRNQEKSDSTSLKFLRGKTKFSKKHQLTELGLECSYHFIARGTKTCAYVCVTGILIGSLKT